jgi:hypothetical protein
VFEVKPVELFKSDHLEGLVEILQFDTQGRNRGPMWQSHLYRITIEGQVLSRWGNDNPSNCATFLFGRSIATA